MAIAGHGSAPAFLAGGGEAGARLRGLDASPLGPPAEWPAPLRAMVQLMLTTGHPVFIFWGPRRLCLYNDAYAASLGPEKHPAMTGQPGRDWFPEIWDIVGPQIEQVMAGGAPTWHENQRVPILRNGAIEDVYWTYSYGPIADETAPHGVGGVLVLCTETTAQVLGEQRYRVMAETLPQLVWTCRPDGSCDYLSRQWVEYTGMAEAEQLGLDWLDRVIHPRDRDRTYQHWMGAVAGRHPYDIEYRIRRHNGEYRWFKTRGTPVPAADGSIGSWFGTCTDIEDIVAAREVLRRSREELDELVRLRTAELDSAQEALRQSQKLEAMGQLTGGVAHDFNNLLTPIIGGLDMLQRRGFGGERERQLIEGALQSAERAKTLVQRLLAFARRQPLQARAIDIAALVEEMAALIRSTVGPRIDVVLELDTGLPTARADANQLEMALLNLAANARDAMPGGGRLTVAAGTESVTGSHRAGLRAGDFVRLSVGDTGKGMDAATLARAVEPFFTTKGVGQGTGLGLSMVHGLAAQSGGALVVDSTPDRGTVVTLWLPAAGSETGMPTAGRAGTAALPRAGTALLVDDEPLVRMSTAAMLAELGYDVTELDSAPAALAYLAAGRPADLLITDHLMPGMTGTELVHQVRRRWPAIGTLVISGYADLDGLDPALCRLTKPFRADELTEAIETCGATFAGAAG